MEGALPHKLLTPLEQGHTWLYGNTAKWLLGLRKKGVDWMVGNPLDFHDYSSRSSARVTAVLKKISVGGLSKRFEMLLWH